MKLLAIGNSFSQDATYYLHQILQAAGIECEISNLYIGGCTLEKHWKNIEEDLQEYQLFINGVNTDRMVTIRETLEEGGWDIILTQQASGFSGWKDSYEPFLGNMLAYLRKMAPEAKFFIHETWAYENDSTHSHFARYNRSQQEMFERLKDAYHTMADKYNLPLILSGELIQRIRQLPEFASGEKSICRDGFHMHFIYGRYATACAWAKKIFGVTVTGNSYVPVTDKLPDETADMQLIATIQKLVDEIC